MNDNYLETVKTVFTPNIFRPCAPLKVLISVEDNKSVNSVLVNHSYTGRAYLYCILSKVWEIYGRGVRHVKVNSLW